MNYLFLKNVFTIIIAFSAYISVQISPFSFGSALSYSSQKSRVKIWFGLVEPFKSYRVHKHFSAGAETPIRGSYIRPVMPISELGCAIPVKSYVLKFGLDWLKSEVC